MNSNFIKVRRPTWRFTIVLPILIKDLLEAIRVDGAYIAAVSITIALNGLNRVVDILIITCLNGSDHVLILVEDSCGNG